MYIFLSCVKQKQNKPCEAKDMYISSLFKGSYKYAKQLGGDIYILSAKYGLLKPDTIIEPYEQTLNAEDRNGIKRWSKQVIEQMKKEGINFNDKAVFLCGKNYRMYLMPLFKTAAAPLKHLGIGKQLAFYKNL